MKLRELFEDPVLFSRKLLGFDPFPYQEELLRDRSKRIVACMGRQTGKSTTIAAKAIHFAFTHPRTTTLIVSATLRQSMLMFDKIASFLLRGPLRNSVAYRSRSRIRLTNGSWIIALPCGRSGFSLRGHTAHLLILDEAAFMPEEVITNVLLPMLSTTNGSCWMLSTPWSRDHVFYRAFTDKAWSVHHYPTSVNPLVKPEFLKEQRALIGEERFAMEYEAKFVDEARSYFPSSLITRCSEDYELDARGELYCGYDPGGRMDYAAFSCLRSDGSLKVAYYRMWKGEDYTKVNLDIADFSKSHDVATILVDQTGLGRPLVEHLKALGLPAEGITVTKRVKEELMSNLKLNLERGALLLPYDREIFSSLNCIEYERDRSGGYEFYHRRGTHDDLAFSIALACYATRLRGTVLRL